MPYNQNIPQPNDQISQSQADLLNNFQSLQTFLQVNHSDINSGNQGKHKFVEFPVQAVAPVTVGAEIGLYTRTSPLTAEAELVVLKQAGSTAPITSYEITSAGYTVAGWSRLPSGILLKWGTSSPAGAGAHAVVFPVGVTIPAFTAVYNAQVTPSSNIDVFVSALTGLQLTVTASGAGSFYYMVTGV